MSILKIKHLHLVVSKGLCTEARARIDRARSCGTISCDFLWGLPEKLKGPTLVSTKVKIILIRNPSKVSSEPNVKSINILPSCARAVVESSCLIKRKHGREQRFLGYKTNRV